MLSAPVGVRVSSRTRSQQPRAIAEKDLHRLSIERLEEEMPVNTRELLRDVGVTEDAAAPLLASRAAPPERTC